jgi:hypothetical protein
MLTTPEQHFLVEAQAWGSRKPTQMTCATIWLGIDGACS